MNIRVILAGIAAVACTLIFAVVSMIFGGSRTSIATGEPTPEVMAERRAPGANNNPMTPVTEDEAERRATLHANISTKQARATSAGIAPPVVTEIREASPDDPLSVELFGDFPTTPEPETKVAAQPEPEPEPEPAPQPESAQNDIGPLLDQYRDSLGVQMGNRDTRYGVRQVSEPYNGPWEKTSLLDGLLETPLPFGRARTDEGWFKPFQVAADLSDTELQRLIQGQTPNRLQYFPPAPPQPWPQGPTGYAAPDMDERSPARPAMTSVDQYGQPYTTSNQPNPYLAGRSGPLVMARGGDMIYATLLYGFNSDDVRGLPIYATLMDFLPNGERGPLHNARVQGQVAYSGHNAAIVFNHLVLPSGREFDISAIAVGRDARTGVAEKVDYHTLQRYGSLFLAGIISGIGEVAQYRLRDRDQGNTIIIGGEGDIHVGRRGEPTDGEVIAGALAPVGRNLSSAAQQGFNRPPTISAPAGMGFALVFTDTIVLDPTNEQRAYNPRTGRMEIVPAGSISAEPQPVQPDQTGALPTHNPFVDWQAADDGISDAIMQAFPQ